ncbi:GDP/GTP exchange factor for ARF [Spiromyces aspiralis]|uniref:GDP/GTP exchange factor for ARF n=1 Tax=Spiromyces aspiralis TaxID=68401 RepID=A0ACC1HGY6_9FUNG|nr:GDP/GTP exchange factor for ARF [Spiromyces aspiralis]
MAGSARANDPGQQDIVSAALQYDPGQLFFMERVVAVVRKSGARVLAVWSVIEKGFERILEHADSQPPYVVERTVSGILDLALTSASAHADSQGHSEHEEVLERIFQCLGLLRDVSRVTTFTRVADYIAIGLYDIAEANPSILLTKKNWSVVSHLLRSLANVGDQVIYPSPAQQVGFEIVLRLAKAITDGKVPPSHLAPVIDTLQEYIPPSRLFKMIGGGSCDKQVSETVGSGGVDAASLPIHVQVANQEAARKTAAQVVSTIHGLGEYIKREHLRSQTQPPDRQLIYQWIDLLSHLSKFSHDRQREIRNQAGSLLQQALIQTEFFEPDPAAPGLWALEIFAKILFPLFDRLQRFDYLADFQMEDAHTRTISTLVTFFLHHLTELQQYQAAVAPDLSGKVMSPRSFDRDSPALHHQIAAMGDDGWTAIWFRIVGILVRYIEVDHLNNVPGSQAAQEASKKLSPTAESEDGRQQHVPMAKMHQKLLADIAENNLKNIVLVADSTGVFRDGDGSGYNQLWRDTFGLIDPVRPGLKHTLFPDTEPPKSESEPQSQPTNLAYLDVGIQRSPQASASPPLEDTPLPDTGHDVYHQGPDRTVLLSTDSKISGLTEKSDGYTPKEKPRSSVQQQQHHQHQGGSKRKNLIIMPEDSTTDHEEV